MREEISAAYFFGLIVEHIDKQPPDDLALAFRIGDAIEFAQKCFRRIHMHERNVVVLSKQIDDSFGFVLAQHAVIDENTSQLIADGLMDEHGCDC